MCRGVYHSVWYTLTINQDFYLCTVCTVVVFPFAGVDDEEIALNKNLKCEIGRQFVERGEANEPYNLLFKVYKAFGSFHR